MNAVFSSRSTGDGGISPVSAPGICVTANCSAIAWHPPLWMEGRCCGGALADGGRGPPASRWGGRASGERCTQHMSRTRVRQRRRSAPWERRNGAWGATFRAAGRVRADVDNRECARVGSAAVGPCGRPAVGLAAAPGSEKGASVVGRSRAWRSLLVVAAVALALGVVSACGGGGGGGGG